MWASFTRFAVSLMYFLRSPRKTRHCCPTRDAGIFPALISRLVVFSEMSRSLETFVMDSALLTIENSVSFRSNE